MREKGPDFFVVGAPRSGTTSLYRYMGRHPHVFVPPLKEPHFFSYPEVADTYYSVPFVTNRGDYLTLFQGRRGERAAGDFSPSYLYHPEAPERIRLFRREARIVILLRDPVQRAISHYLLDHSLGLTNGTLLESLQPSAENRLFYREYVEVGRYSAQVERYLRTFGPERVLVILFDELVRDRDDVLRQVVDFVGADGDIAVDTRAIHNATLAPRSEFVRRLTLNPILAGAFRSLPSSARRVLNDVLFVRERPGFQEEEVELARAFREDVAKLEALLGRDLSHWLS